jgi:hypothetical protein
MDNKTKGYLEILIHEIQEARTKEEIEQILDIWIKGNNLHPETVKTFGDNPKITLRTRKKVIFGGKK